MLETKWIRDKVKEIGDGYNILYTRKTNRRNRDRFILDKVIKTKVVEVKRKNDRIISVKLFLNSSIESVINVYAPQKGRVHRGWEKCISAGYRQGHARDTRKQENHNWR